MVQEVQQQGNRYQTPNLIPGVGISERKVKDHTQVTPSFGYECAVGCSVSLSASENHRQSDPAQGTFTFTSIDGATEFKLIEGGLRIPLAGAYLAEMTFKGGTAQGKMTHKLKVGKKTILSQETTSNLDTVVLTKILNLGRYDIVEYRGDLYYSGSGGFSGTATFTLSLKKL